MYTYSWWNMSLDASTTRCTEIAQWAHGCKNSLGAHHKGALSTSAAKTSTWEFTWEWVLARDTTVMEWTLRTCTALDSSRAFQGFNVSREMLREKKHT